MLRPLPFALGILLLRRERPLGVWQRGQRDVEHVVDDAEPVALPHHDEHPVEVAEGLLAGRQQGIITRPGS